MTSQVPPQDPRGRSNSDLIPIDALRAIRKQFKLRMVILVAWDGNREHVVTDGETLDDADGAAQGGNLVKAALNWSPEMRAESTRVSELLRRVAVLCEVADLARDDAVVGRPGRELGPAIASVQEAMQDGWSFSATCASEFVRRVAELCSLADEVDQTPSDKRDPLRRAIALVREAMQDGWSFPGSAVSSIQTWRDEVRARIDRNAYPADGGRARSDDLAANMTLGGVLEILTATPTCGSDEL